MAAALVAFLPIEPHDAFLYAANSVTVQLPPQSLTPSFMHDTTSGTKLEELSTLKHG